MEVYTFTPMIVIVLLFLKGELYLHINIMDSYGTESKIALGSGVILGGLASPGVG